MISVKQSHTVHKLKLKRYEIAQESPDYMNTNEYDNSKRIWQRG